MILEKKLQEDLKLAMKDHCQHMIDAIRAIKSAVQIEKTKGMAHDLEDDDVVKIISKLSKQYQEDIDQYSAAGRIDLVKKSANEKEVFDSYLPKILSNDEVVEIIDRYIAESGATSMKDMGKVMSYLSKTISNRYDPKFASAHIKEILSR